MYLYLVRHGQSVGNQKKLFFGKSDYPLTDLGREQARQAAEKLREVDFSRCCASDLSRAWETARICLEGRDVAPEPCPDLQEQDMGRLENLGWVEAETFWPPLRNLIADWYHTPPPEGEDPADMAARVGRCVDGILRRGEDTLVVAHNGSLSLILKHLGLAEEDRLMKPGLFFDHGTYSAIRVGPEGAELERFNR